MKALSYILIILLLFLVNCSEKEDQQLSSYTGAGFEIYKVETDTFTNLYRYHRDIDLEGLRIGDKAWLSHDDIDYYDFSTHIIHLKKTVFDQEEMVDNIEYYLVTANDERIYLFVNWPPYLCSLPLLPFFSTYFLAGDLIKINHIPRHNDSLYEDPRKDERIKQALRDDNKFRAGIQCELIDVDAYERHISYSFQITNLEQDGIYVLDPDLLNAGDKNRFFRNIYITDSAKGYYPETYSPDMEGTPKTYSEHWYSKLEGGASIVRSVELEHFPEVPEGNYEALFIYYSPYDLTKSQRSIDGVRVWMGELQSKLNIHL